MENKELQKTVIRAIKEKKTLRLQIMYGLGQQIEIDLEPYIFGSDMMQYDFVWGFIRHNRTFYKLLTKFIVTCQVTDTAFTVQPDTAYLYAIEEDHAETIDGIAIYGASVSNITM